MFDDAGKSDHGEVFSGPGEIKVLSRLGGHKAWFSAPIIKICSEHHLEVCTLPLLRPIIAHRTCIEILGGGGGGGD